MTRTKQMVTIMPKLPLERTTYSAVYAFRNLLDLGGQMRKTGKSITITMSGVPVAVLSALPIEEVAHSHHETTAPQEPVFYDPYTPERCAEDEREFQKWKAQVDALDREREAQKNK